MMDNTRFETRIDRIRLFCEVLEETDLQQARGYYAHDGGFCAFGALGETLVRRSVHGWSEGRHKSHDHTQALHWINEGAPDDKVPELWPGRVGMRTNDLGRSIYRRYWINKDPDAVRFWQHTVPIYTSVVSLNDDYEASFSEIAALIRLEFNLPKVAPPLLALMDEPEAEPVPVQVKPQRELEPA